MCTYFKKVFGFWGFFFVSIGYLFFRLLWNSAFASLIIVFRLKHLCNVFIVALPFKRDVSAANSYNNPAFFYHQSIVTNAYKHTLKEVSFYVSLCFISFYVSFTYMCICSLHNIWNHEFFIPPLKTFSKQTFDLFLKNPPNIEI